jgi:cell division protein FtsW
MLTTPAGIRRRRAAAPALTSVTPRRAEQVERAGTATSSVYLLLGVVVTLNAVGVVMVLSASSVLSISQYGTPWHYFERQLLWLGIGIAAFAVAFRVDHRRWRKLARPGMAIVLVLLVAVLVPGVGVKVSGASRWIGTSSVQLQPSEMAKLALVFYAADVLDRRVERGERGEWWYQMGPVLVVFVVLAGLVLEQPDMGTTLVLGLIVLAVLFTAGLPRRPLVAMLGLATVASLLLALAAPYRWRRMTSFLHPIAHASDTGYQSVQGLTALSHGHVTGDGIGASIASWGGLPNAHTDFIFAIIGEETGLIGTVFMSALFVVLALVGVRIAWAARSHFSGLVAAGITAWLVGQAVINIGAVVGLLPVTGVPLPFVSFGGSSLVIALFGAGVLANIARQP